MVVGIRYLVGNGLRFLGILKPHLADAVLFVGLHFVEITSFSDRVVQAFYQSTLVNTTEIVNTIL
jgi:hypothetical protein